jgi:hypothetical protein
LWETEKEEHVSSVILRILNYFQVFRAPTKPLPYSQSKRRKSRDREESMAFIKACTAALSSKDSNECSESESEAVGVNVAAKLQKMNSSQQIFDELLINKVLAKGLMNKLSEETDIPEFSCLGNFSRHATSSLSTSSNTSVRQYYEDASQQLTDAVSFVPV